MIENFVNSQKRSTDTQTCYLCDTEKELDAFILRKDKVRYRMCSDCNDDVQKKRTQFGNKKLHHTSTHRTCYKCMRFLDVNEFTKRASGNYFSACKDCNKFVFAHNRRARLRNAEGSFTTKEFNQLLKKFDACPMCDRKWQDIPLPEHMKNPWTADHIIPITPLNEGDSPGSNYIANIRPLCYSCNSRKGNRPT